MIRNIAAIFFKVAAITQVWPRISANSEHEVVVFDGSQFHHIHADNLVCVCVCVCVPWLKSLTDSGPS